MLVMHVITNLAVAGGAEASLVQLVKNNQADQQVVVSLREHGENGKRLEELGIEVHSLHMPRGRVNVSGLKKLFKLIRTTRPDVIQTWMYHSDLFAGIVARIAGNKSVCWGIHHSNLNKDANSSALLWVVRACALMSWVVPKKIISCSVKSKEVHQAWRYRKSLITVVPNGYDIDRFNVDSVKRAAFREANGLSDEIVLGMVGRWDPQKDHEVLIKAMSYVNNNQEQALKCVLVGEGMDPNNTELMSLLAAQQMTDHFRLLGTTDDVPAVMNGIDIHLLSSRGEAFPNVVAEAMACETPCVVTDVGDAALIVGETGWVVPPRSPEALGKGIAQAITAMSDNPAWQQRCRDSRARIVGDYQIGKVVQLYRDVWQSAR